MLVHEVISAHSPALPTCCGASARCGGIGRVLEPYRGLLERHIGAQRPMAAFHGLRWHLKRDMLWRRHDAAISAGLADEAARRLLA